MAEKDPDYAGPEGTKFREEAHKFGDERSKLLDAANVAFKSGDKAKAKQLSEQGKAAGEKMTNANQKAARAVLKHRNHGHGEDYLDLHGLFLEEAMVALTERLDLLKKLNQAVAFTVIPGAGNHSKAGAVIKPKVIEELKRRKLQFTEKNAGTLLVIIEGKTSEGGFASQPTGTGNTEPVSSHGCCVIM